MKTHIQKVEKYGLSLGGFRGRVQSLSLGDLNWKGVAYLWETSRGRVGDIKGKFVVCLWETSMGRVQLISGIPQGEVCHCGMSLGDLKGKGAAYLLKGEVCSLSHWEASRGSVLLISGIPQGKGCGMYMLALFFCYHVHVIFFCMHTINNPILFVFSDCVYRPVVYIALVCIWARQ